MINKLIIDTLRPLNIPVSFLKTSSKVFPYITFFEYLEQGEEYEDDEEVGTGYYIQVDIWSKDDYSNINDQVINLLEIQGFKRQTCQDFYESDTQVFHRVIRFFYLKEN